MSTKRNTPKIPIKPSPNLVVVERILVKSKLEKDQDSKDAKIKLSADMIAKRNQEALEESHDVLKVWEEHPLAGIVVAIGDKVAEEYELSVGDKIGWRITEQTGQLIVFKKKKYTGLFGHEILFRYLTSEV